MATKKRSKRSAQRSAPQVEQHKIGDRVRVRAGDWGNSVGVVEGVKGGECRVRLGRELLTFDGDNLIAGGPLDRF